MFSIDISPTTYLLTVHSPTKQHIKNGDICPDVAIRCCLLNNVYQQCFGLLNTGTTINDALTAIFLSDSNFF